MNLWRVQRRRSFRGRDAMRDLNEANNPSVQMVERVVTSPLRGNTISGLMGKLLQLKTETMLTR